MNHPYKNHLTPSDNTEPDSYINLAGKSCLFELKTKLMFEKNEKKEEKKEEEEKNKKLHNIIKAIQEDEVWKYFLNKEIISTFQEGKNIRNAIVHSDFEELFKIAQIPTNLSGKEKNKRLELLIKFQKNKELHEILERKIKQCLYLVELICWFESVYKRAFCSPSDNSQSENSSFYKHGVACVRANETYYINDKFKTGILKPNKIEAYAWLLCIDDDYKKHKKDLEDLRSELNHKEKKKAQLQKEKILNTIKTVGDENIGIHGQRGIARFLNKIEI